MDIGKSSAKELASFWHRRDPHEWYSQPETFVRLAERALALGESLLAVDVTAEARKHSLGNQRINELHVLALARSGSSFRANMLAKELLQLGSPTDELLGILARTHKDLALAANDSVAAKGHLYEAVRYYKLSAEKSKVYASWGCVNAATLSLLLNDVDAAKVLAQKGYTWAVREFEQAKPNTDNQFWAAATIGEAELVLGHPSAAVDWYRQANQFGQQKFGHIASSRRNIEILAKAGIEGCAESLAVLTLPKVCVFSGHMTDSPDRPVPRLPESATDMLRARLREALGRIGPLIAYSSAARGADIIFLELMMELGMKVHVTLPFPVEDFVAISVAPSDGNEQWLARFQRVMEHAASVTTASPGPSSDLAFLYGNAMQYGLAANMADEIKTSLHAIAVWDGAPGPLGGTSSAIDCWVRHGQSVEILHPTDPNQDRLVPGMSDIDLHSPTSFLSDPSGKTRVVSILFADVAGYSKFNDEQVLCFADRFLGAVRETIDTMDEAPVVRNTWGDGLYMVFLSPRTAGVFALRLARRIRETDWAEEGLPKHVGIRIALHSGPAMKILDPVTGNENYTGTHVSRAARLEPMTPVGEVYCSEAYAALCSALRINEFSCCYVGKIGLAKNYGEFSTYRVVAGEHWRTGQPTK